MNEAYEAYFRNSFTCLPSRDLPYERFLHSMNNTAYVITVVKYIGILI